MARTQRLMRNVSVPVFFASAAAIFAFVVFAAGFTEEARAAFEAAQRMVLWGTGWFYMLALTLFLLFAMGLLASPLGKIRLGRDDERPEYGFAAWFAMLFSAGIGITLLFFSVAEPLLHYSSPPTSAGGTPADARAAMGYLFLHWGLHGWAIYVVVGLALAYFAFRRGLPLTIRSALYPLIGERIYGPIGHAADVFAVLGTMFGIATSLGLGAGQLNAGLTRLFGVPDALWVELLLIGGITAVATLSVVLGLTRGIRRLSLLNMALALTLLFFTFAFGPAAEIVRAFGPNLGQYLSVTLVEHTLFQGAFADVTGRGWMGSWTLFYWGWWIAWSPFVGMFIARISRGRTVRQFVAGVLGAGSGFVFIWLTVFGEAALQAELAGAGGLVQAVEEDLPAAFFALMERLPLPTASSALALVLMTTLFVTSSDSGSLVIDIITAGGDPDPPVAQRIFWAVVEGVVAGVLLVAGGLSALQTASIVGALPFAVVLVFIAYGLFKALWADYRGAWTPAAKECAEEGAALVQEQTGRML